MNTTEAIIFDLGGVLMNISFEATAAAFQELAGQNFQVLYNKHRQNPLFDDFEMGCITPKVFRDGLRKLLDQPISDEKLDWAWNSVLVDIPKERMEMVKRLRQEKRVFLLSNTNAIHKKAFDVMFDNVFPGQKIEDLFEEAYFSHLMGDRKPNPSIYRQIVENHELIPEKTVFVDDLVQNVEGAKKVGLQGLHLQPPQTVLDIKWA